jgi:hypothetical protein
MYRNPKNFLMCSETSIIEFLAQHNSKLQAAINKEAEDYILNVNEEQFINYFAQEFTIDIPRPLTEFDINSMFVSDYEAQISPEDFPVEFPIRHFSRVIRTGKTVPKQVIVYHLPFSGEGKFLHYNPGKSLRFPEVFIEDHSLCFEIINFSENESEIRRLAVPIINDIQSIWLSLISDLEPFNNQLSRNIEQMLKARKQKLLANKQMLASLGVPLRKRNDLPATFAIPTPQSIKPLMVRPTVTERGFRPEPKLDQTTYQEILEIIHSMGKEFETLPGTYFNKGEEELRDHYLLFLAPRFRNEGSVTGKTFSKVGKTDIVYRYENSNVFVAECKFWKGQAQYIQTINQLLSYLTWRDSKAAIIIFVKNKEMSSVLESVRQVTPQHPNYLGFVNEQDTSWFNYRFHINDDPNREVKLAVMLYHIPDVYGGRVKQN